MDVKKKIKNMYRTIESKIEVNKTAVRPILTFAAETRVDTKNMKQNAKYRTLADGLKITMGKWTKHMNRMSPNTAAKISQQII